jgi:hypothetical protein
MVSGKIADNSASANSQTTDSMIDNHIGKNSFNLPTNDPVDQNDR